MTRRLHPVYRRFCNIAAMLMLALAGLVAPGTAAAQGCYMSATGTLAFGTVSAGRADKLRYTTRQDEETMAVEILPAK